MENSQYPLEYRNLEVEEGRYLPPIGDIYDHENPHTHCTDFKHVQDVTVDANYPFLDRSWKMRFWSFLYYARAKYLIRWLHYLVYGYKIVGRENYKKYKNTIYKDGAMTVANHVYRWDMAGVMDSRNWKHIWFPIWRDQLCGPDARHMRAVGGIPVPESLAAMRKFYAAFDWVHEQKDWIHFFAEESRWDYYVPIRPFKKGAFVFAVRYNMPIMPCAYSYRERKGILKYFGKGPCITLNVGEPILINQELLKTNKNAAIDDLRKRTHEAMCKLAGIKKNPWEYNQTEK